MSYFSAVPEQLLADVRVLDVTGEAAVVAARVLADLGAEVTRLEPADDPLRRQPLRHAAWTARSTVVVDPGPDEQARLLGEADVVLHTPYDPAVPSVDRAGAPQAVWVDVTPFGLEGPRAIWRASDLGIMAASGNLYATGDPDRPPVRCTEPAGYAHVGPEAAFAALTGLASGRPQHIDLSMQEVILVANMGAAGRYARDGSRGKRRGANIGRTREIWPCADGFVSFGLRGGKARVASFETLTRLIEAEGLGTPALTERDWTTFSHTTASDEELAAIEEPVATYFARHTMTELYEIACETNLMLAPANSPKEIYASAQLAAREVFGPVGDLPHAPQRFVHVHHPPGSGAPRSSDRRLERARTEGVGAWSGVRIVEFGSGAAGPIATRYFAEHGAEVVRVESRSRPDFLRVYALGPDNPHGLEGSGMFDQLNAGKRGVTLNLKDPDGRALALGLVGWADAVAENFAPKAMRGLGLDYDTLREHKPDLVMISACLNGQTGPHRDYPGFGGQGSALSGFNFLTGWPDREPIGPAGTITDSLAPRFVASALAAALLHLRRTGEGVYLDLSQVEAAVWSLAPWLADFDVNDRISGRNGNRHGGAELHGLFPTQGDDRWVAIAAWTPDEWRVLAGLVGADTDEDDPDAREAAVAAWTATRDALDVADYLQGLGLEAVPVADFGDVHDDPQLAARDHLQPLIHPVLGPGEYERNGFRLSDAPSGYDRPSPTLGQDNAWLLSEVLDLDAAEIARLTDAGVLD